jgi:WG containing repeat
MIPTNRTPGRAGRCFCWLLLAAVIATEARAADNKQPLVVVENGKYGYIDHEGRVIIPPQFIWAEDFWRGLGTVYVCGRYLSIDSSGTLLPLRIAVEGQLVPQRSENKVGFVDSSGHFKIAPSFDDALPFSDGLAAVRVAEKWGFINESGKEVIQPQFEDAFYFRQGVGVVSSDSGFALIDTSGKTIAGGFQFIDLISEGRIPVSREDRSGYLDLRGNVAIPFIYDAVNAFSEGLAAVEKDEKWGYVDRDGKPLVPFKFDDAGPFAHGLAAAKIGDRSGFINRSGEFVFYLAFEYAPGFLAGDETSDLLTATTDVSRFWTKDNRFGYVNTAGKVIWGPVEGRPAHPPLFGWSEKDKSDSCKNIPESVSRTIAGFPDR